MVRNNPVSVLTAETGSGKTTQVPQFLYQDGFAKTGVIAVTQPRIVGAKASANRVAREMGVEVGQEVGYVVRFDSVTSDKTVLQYMTDGLLLRECIFDGSLKKYSVIIIDEAHERTISTDILFGYLKRILQKRPQLKCLIMSATLEAKRFQDYWNGAPLLQITGREFPVEILFSFRPLKDYLERAIELCMEIHAMEKPGDILVFLCGEEEIEHACFEIKKRNKRGDLCVLPFYSSLPQMQQQVVFRKVSHGMRKVIVATNVAETSLTIEGVVYVVDSGLCKQKLYNPRTHTETLLTGPVSKDSAMQRAGRAGRTQPGKCFRLYTAAAFKDELPDRTHPEILRSNLNFSVLNLKRLGVEELMSFDFMDPPSPESIMRALEMLSFLGALNDEGNLTGIGSLMSEFPIDPHLSRTVISACHRGCCEMAIMLVSMLQGSSALLRPQEQRWLANSRHNTLASKSGDRSGDHISLLTIYSLYIEKFDKSQFCKDFFLHEKKLQDAENLCQQLRHICRKLGLSESSKTVGRDQKCKSYSDLLKSILDGFFMQSAYMDPGGKYYLTITDHKIVHIQTESFLKTRPEWVVYNKLVLREHKWYMQTVTSIPPEMWLEFAPKLKMCKRNEETLQP